MTAIRSSRWTPYWTCQIAGWGLYATSQFASAIVAIHLPWLRAALEILLLNAAALLLSHRLHSYIKRQHWDRFRLRPLAARISVASFVLAAPLALVAPLTSVRLLHDPAVILGGPPLGPALSVVLHWLNWAGSFACWQIVYFVTVAARRRRFAELRQSELARALQHAELRLLKSQLNPHFLFNSLNTVRSLIADDPRRAQSAVTRLANTLRYTLSAGQEERVPLARELEIVADYLEIESIRFETRLAIRYRVSPAAAEVQIPVMLLQTVVENAIKHGIAELPGGGILEICGDLHEGTLHLEVTNSRPPGPAPKPEPGTGLRNAAERLRLLFGPAARIDLDLSQSGLAVTRICIPAQE
ncbi:MAG TPA: histidine kinase [Steroidobacteraceae bacterium]|nr:histidine kinase [Steroidobacteraceae bacterium]